MTTAAATPSPDDLALLARVIRQITRHRRMSPEDAEDFTQSVWVRLIEREYDVVHRFRGRSSLRTYLTVVVERMLLDWRNSRYGKWRPTAAAVRLGDHAVELERLIHRDGFTPDEAARSMGSRADAPTADALQSLLERLPPRPPRRPIAVELCPEAVPTVPFEDPLDAREQHAAHARISACLAAAVRTLSASDRRLIVLRYHRKRSVQAIARLLQTDPKTLYRRFEQLLRTLRRSLAEQGVTGSSAIETRI
jgi:RNA polymerase sigma factor for flagellar operon FliA